MLVLESRTTSPEVASAAPRLLVVDDDETNRDLLSRRLATQGFAVITAASGDEALAVLASRPCDAVLLDVMMPGQSGLDVLAAIRRERATRDVPVIMVTARSGSQDVAEALDLGANDYVTKPVDFVIAAARVRAQLARVKAEHAGLASQRQDDLLFAQKLSAVGQLTSGVVHDVNNVLATISGYGERLQAHLAPDDARRRDVTKILSAVDTGAGLTRQLLAVSRKAGAVVRTVDLRDSARSMADLLAPILGRRIRVEVETGDDPCLATVDVGQFDQLLLNLLLNARDAMPDGGVVRVAVNHAADVNRSASAPAWVRLMVTDGGVGMDAVTRTRIFEPFFTTKPEGRGTGLGLAMVRAIVERFAGRIVVTSAPGQGTTFTVLLPMADDRTPEAADLPSPSGAS